mmetsp:Transcript_4711/g.7686  ORF Transcript_4711/g.7686 Transcript_4711/m.7686 type:complete len:855 (-) Transcript_4711:26-2590(-)|eukprot:CAMPEP_0169080958 /NCGR_PEP_ID=MMETSP1015-20121227/10756_1 /TAXON_ID=342587 /ORGANISM="Karlodinium micrum, Strain CCMP2283" /LENGTH=854 /DNA_ID=CAMNT_0009140717 /DNA_START=78 /DNA_END=2642 /DNA_ORIENTATION=-
MYSNKSSKQLLAATGLPSVDKAANDLLQAMQQISEESDGEDDSPSARRFHNARLGVSASMSGLPDVAMQGKRFTRTPKGRQADSHCNSLPSLPRINASVGIRHDRLRSDARSSLPQDAVGHYDVEFPRDLVRSPSKQRARGSHGVHFAEYGTERKLADELQALKLVHTKTVEELAHAAAHREQAEQEMDESEMKISRLTKDLKNERNEVDRLKAEITRTRAERDHHRADLQQMKLRPAASEELEAEVVQLRKDAKRQRVELEDLRSELARAKNRKEKLKSELQCMKDQSCTIVEAGEDFFKESQAKLRRQAEEVSELKSLLSDAEAEKGESEKQIKELREQVVKAADARTSAENFRHVLERTKFDLTEKSKELEIALASLDKVHRELAAVSTARQQELDDLRNLKAQLAEQEISLKSQEKLRLANERMKAELLEKTKELEAACEARREKEKLLKKFNKENEVASSAAQLKEENEVLRGQLCEKAWEIQKLEDDQEKSINDYAGFFNRVINSSSAPVLQHTLDMSVGDLIGMGHYGYVMTCFHKEAKETVVLKLQSVRWLHVAVREWSHASAIGKHPNIVEAKEALVHSDVDHSIQTRLAAGFDSGALSGKRPKWLPTAYLCMVQEYMDRGTIGSLIERHLLTLEGICAVTRQVASALAFLHQKKRTHNDVKPENILLKRAPDGNHLLVKLADMGMAEHSVARTRDHDLFAYTIWCMVLGREFSRCPEKDARPDAMGELQRAAVLGRKATTRSTVLIEAVDGLWNDRLDTAQIACRPELEGCEVREPDCDVMKKRLKDCAHEDVKSRANEALRRFRHCARKGALLSSICSAMHGGEEDFHDTCSSFTGEVDPLLS